MSNSRHDSGSDRTRDQNGAKYDGSRGGATTAAEAAPERDESAIEAFDEEGAGIAPKE